MQSPEAGWGTELGSQQPWPLRGPQGVPPSSTRPEPQAWKMSSVIFVVGQWGPRLRHTAPGGDRHDTRHYSTLGDSADKGAIRTQPGTQTIALLCEEAEFCFV